jgi:hypothetical protein
MRIVIAQKARASGCWEVVDFGTDHYSVEEYWPSWENRNDVVNQRSDSAKQQMQDVEEPYEVEYQMGDRSDQFVACRAEGSIGAAQVGSVPSEEEVEAAVTVDEP